MAVDPIIARGTQPLDVSNALLGIAGLRQRDKALAQDQQVIDFRQNALMQAQQQAEDDDAEWEQAYAAKDWGRMARLDPQTTKILWDLEQAAQPAKPDYRVVGGALVEITPEGPREAYRPEQRAPLRAPGAEGGSAPALGKAPPGYRWTVDGNLEPIPGGPADAKTTQPLSPKDTNTARVKLTQVQIARNQLNTAKQRFEALRNTFSAGPGGNLLPTPEGKAFDAAIDSMRGSITALTRVPGVGAMSDYETRLDQAKFPTRGKYEEVAEQQLLALEELLNTIEGGYSELLGAKPGSPPNTDAAPEPKVQRREAPASAVEHLRKNPQLKAAFFEKYGYLPDGI